MPTARRALTRTGARVLLELVLTGAFLATLASGLLCWIRPWVPAARARARLLSCAAAVLETAAVGRLLAALLRPEFGFEYVSSHVSRSLPAVYRVAALWNGQEGSLLLWACISCIAAALTLLPRAGEDEPAGRARARAGGVLALLAAAWTLPVAVHASPFEQVAVPGADGVGMSLVLQKAHMLLHPPLVYVGYALLGVTYAWTVSGLVSREPRPADARDAAPALPTSTLAASRWGWLLLAAGILVGAHWAYQELGWGGYWAWDPVENASLVPWLLVTALLHEAPRAPAPDFSRWPYLLAASPYVAAVAGIWATRTGWFVSVHTFTDPGLAVWLALPVGLAVALPAVAVVQRRRQRPAPHAAAEDGKAGQESRNSGGLCFTSSLLVGAAAIVAGATAFPILWEGVRAIHGGPRVVLGPSFFDRALAPIGALLLGWLLVSHRAALGVGRPGTVRRWSLTALHAGVLLILVGLAGSHWDEETTLSLRPGETAAAAGFSVGLLALEEQRLPGGAGDGGGLRGISVVAELALAPQGQGGSGARVRTAKVFTSGSAVPYTRIGTLHRGHQDVHVILTGWESGGQRAYFRVLRRPLVNALWIGGLLVVSGGLLNLAAPGRALQPVRLPSHPLRP